MADGSIPTTHTDPAAPLTRAPATGTVARPLLRCWLEVWAILIALLYALRFLHLSADFPGHAPWHDWTTLTDEGWYTSAAIRYHLTGHWFLPGDFNPAVALPVWPLLAAALFHFTGVSLVVARALVVVLFGITLLASYALVKRHSGRAAPLAAIITVTLMAADPFLYAFGRLAILEPVLLCWNALALLLADWAGTRASRAKTTSGRYLPAVGLGLLLTVMLLTKTTAVVLLPAIAWLFVTPQWRPDQDAMAASSPRTLTLVLGTLSAVFLTTALAYGVYYQLVLHSSFAADYRYIFTANSFPRPTHLTGWLIDARFSLASLFAPNPPLAIVALAVLIGSLFRPMRGLWRNPLYPASLLQIAGIAFFAFWHNYQAPRYYLFVPIPFAIIVGIGTAAAFRATRHRLRRLLPVFAGCVLILDLLSLLAYLRHPAYSFAHAASGIARIVHAEPAQPALLLGESADQISLMTGIPALCDDFGTAPLPAELDRYRPGWFLTWHAVDPDVLSELHARYRLQHAGSFTVMNAPERNPLLLYRLVPLTEPESGVVVEQEPVPMYHRPRKLH